jgi:ribose transport system permease protein
MRKLLSDYGMVLVLILLCVLFSVLTLKEQIPQDTTAVAQLIERINNEFEKSDIILTVGAVNTGSGPFAEALFNELKADGFSNVEKVLGIPKDLRLKLDDIRAQGGVLAAIATTGDVPKWLVIELMPERYPEFSGCKVLAPESYMWPVFLKRSNLLAIVDRIVVIALIAIGMTMVIITAGIDLSVGSLIALSAVIGTLLMKKMGGLQAPEWVVLVGFLAGILSCGIVGAIGGLLVARFKVAPFITTLGIMMMARGLAFMITGGFSIYQVPSALPWLGQGRSLGIPNTVILLVILYVVAHIFMAHTRMGRYIYAVGGNKEAARLSGVPVRFVIVFVYIISSLAAGLGGCIQASQLNTGTPNIGIMYELYVIAAVVVGGTSLSGGSGRILGTLIGAFIISVIQNGMNLLGIESYTQQVVLGAVILGAVLLDKARSSGGLIAFLQKKITYRIKRR